ncbi:Shedu anti-phage system protein SduA domain-containing protein [Nitrosomonas sp.]|uniref:Shedu anti-phage system protein SduA domain-containing protein n=1 Tax=Nitrosomonas sp. TaxID=42353 RepID=UPI00283B5E42|nr:Shedu anti-phage system protein SduA domain-containing protein [Nitrosomonas sp.]MDR4514493.1 DUF4263 domain-containing protein [Nitrosomonas sp.]
MKTVKNRLFRVLKNKARVVTRAGFWKIPHDSREDEISLKVGRYTKPENWDESEEPETHKPRSELTLDHEEFIALIEFLQDNYEPFKHGVKAFIPLDRPFDQSNADQIKALFSLPRKKELVDFILKNEVIPEELAIGLEQAKRRKAIVDFQQMLGNDQVESNWQTWFQENSWVLGSEFVKVLDERHIDTHNISDFLMEAYDGFLDIVEIKRPEGQLRFWSASRDHGNPVPSQGLIKAITQASRYIYEVEREANSIKFLERVDNVRTVKPRGTLIFGRSGEWSSDEIEAYRILNSSYHNLSIMTYDHVLQRARQMVGM